MSIATFNGNAISYDKIINKVLKLDESDNYKFPNAKYSDIANDIIQEFNNSEQK